ncbi:hypothetical protein, partial [Achromobacter sp.]|uniref:hypothetical protein n=1 Tax=Achromobacter sp. TaxID=134375 RepID=UPI002F922A0D
AEAAGAASDSDVLAAREAREADAPAAGDVRGDPADGLADKPADNPANAPPLGEPGIVPR